MDYGKGIGKFAVDIVMGSAILMKQLKELPLDLEEKKSHSDLVTAVDQQIEEFLVKCISDKYPKHGILGEEGVYEGTLEDKDTVWVIDPIDGTTNFIHGFPYYGISVAVVRKGIGIVGVIYNPETDELFFAEAGKGAYVNGKRISLEHKLKLRDSLISTTMFWENHETKTTLHPSIVELYKESRGIRMVGGAAVSLCEVAMGRLNAYIMPNLNAWDYAAGAVILKEAGGSLSKVNGGNVSLENGGSLVASHPDIHSELLRKFVNG
jgi:myo-inositol-1(or 4)-monophosphatase